ncbi:MAG TPA: AAA family ATPase [Solirubrobacteraceae bacterium]|nr:AAA family ATPase [Solirubrobacteraceae bacterium]
MKHAASAIKAGTGTTKAVHAATHHIVIPVIHGPSTFLGYPDVTSFLQAWLPIVFMGALVIGVFALMRFMPRTRPEQIKPDSAPSIGWTDIAGADEAKEELREVVDYLRDPERFRAIGAKVPKGILLHGPPGTGKTLLAKAVAHESGATFFSASAASFVEMFVGVGAARIRHLFKAARKKAPAIVFIDELDAVGGHRGMDVSGERDQTLNQLLVEMDGFTARKEVVVIAASNLLEKLDPALLRPGRFDRQIFVSPPDVNGREKIFHVHSRNKRLADGLNLNLLARQTSGLTGADIANICNEAAIFAARRGADRVSMKDFDAALERVVAGMQSLRALTEHEKRVVAYHEAGHALCGELLPSVDRVHRISIVPRGKALGYTLNLPEEDRYLKTREELIDFMTMLLGGRAAEQLVFGSITTGASDDLKRVAEIAHAMVFEYAMGTGSGSLRAIDQGAAEATRRVRDAEVRELADEALRSATSIIDSHRAELDSLATTLLSNEVLERKDIDRIMGHVPRAAPSRIGELSVAAATALNPASPHHRGGKP